MSRRHARIALGPNRQFVITDLPSQNGTFVNGEKSTEARLADGERIKIGEALLNFARLPRMIHRPDRLRQGCGESHRSASRRRKS